MKAFSALVQVLGTSTKTNEKVQALQQYFINAQGEDKVWLIALFSGRRPKRVVNASLLSQWCTEITGIPAWLFEESYHTVGDLAETIALLLPEESVMETDESLSYYMRQLIVLQNATEAEKKIFITGCWKQMDKMQRFVFNKLLTGGFRIGVSQKMMTNALAKAINADAAVMAHRISGQWNPASISFEELTHADAVQQDISKPYPFYLAYALGAELESLGSPEAWLAEWKWDGIRGQIIKRNGEFFVWSRGEELMTEKFPEYAILKTVLPDGVVLDGEIMPWQPGIENNGVLPFAVLQTRIGRKNVTKKQLLEAPVAFFVYDLLEYEGVDIRQWSLLERRNRLAILVQELGLPVLRLSPLILFQTWPDLAQERDKSRDMRAEGLMLKRKESTYQTGRKVGDWWKWKTDPLTIDAVLIYAQKGHGRRSNLYTDYTFAVKDGDKLVSFAKAYSGLTDKEFSEVDAFIKKNSLEKFGPVRTVKPELVFEIAFEGIAASNRHKSGVALRFPRMHRWRRDKKPDEINTLDDLKQLLEQYGK